MLDTHTLVRWLVEPRKLSKEQNRTLDSAVRLAETLALSAITLLGIAILLGDGSRRVNVKVDEPVDELQGNPVFQILPLTFEIASEIASLGAILRDPADRAIVATARVHQLRLMTSAQRIAESKLVSVLE